MNPTLVVLEGDAVRIEPLQRRHANDLLAAAADPAIWRYLPAPQPRSVEQVVAWIDEARELASTGDQLPFAIVDAPAGRAVGSTRYLEIHPAWRTLEIGWTWLAASAQRTRVNTECKYLLLRHAFEKLGALRVQFKTDSRNLQSQRALERLGAVREGVLRKQRINYDGYVRDSVYYSILDEEWPAVKARLEERLARSAGAGVVTPPEGVLVTAAIPVDGRPATVRASPPMSPGFPDAVLAALRAARRVAVLTGAGISAESGIPTFRDALTGLWAQYRPEDLATPLAFARDPELVWRWYRTRRLQLRELLPNPGHLALAGLAARVPELTLITQNVDGLHARAGSRDVLELHGNITRVKCFDEDLPVEEWADTEAVPVCPRCGGLLRPDVVWFGEMLPDDLLRRAREAAERCDLFLSVGTSNVVEPAASLPWTAAEHGATVVVVNPTAEGQRTGPGIHPLLGPAGVVLPALFQAAWPE